MSEYLGIMIMKCTVPTGKIYYRFMVVERGKTISDACKATGVTRFTMEKLCKGEIPMTRKLAEELFKRKDGVVDEEAVEGWLQMQQLYDKYQSGEITDDDDIFMS